MRLMKAAIAELGTAAPKQKMLNPRIYIGASETNLKHRFNKHTRSFNLEHF